MTKHITNDQRNEISALKRAGHKQKDIAHILGKDPSIISRELKRNKSDSGRYLARGAKLKTKERRVKANARFRTVERNAILRRYIVKKLKKYLSPEQIAGQWNRSHQNQRISKDTIYKFVRLINNRPRKRLHYLTHYCLKQKNPHRVLLTRGLFPRT